MSDQAQELRIALVLSELRPGGMERVVIHLAQGLASRSIPTLVVCLQSKGTLAPEFADINVELVALGSLSGKDFGAIWRLRKVLQRFKPSIINIHDYSSAPYAIAANWLSSKAPVQFTAHDRLYEVF